jgi:hypothetical protein
VRELALAQKADVDEWYSKSLPSDEESGLLAEGHAAVGLDDTLVPTCKGVSARSVRNRLFKLVVYVCVPLMS